jgi:hypothetical protein
MRNTSVTIDLGRVRVSAWDVFVPAFHIAMRFAVEPVAGGAMS